MDFCFPSNDLSKFVRFFLKCVWKNSNEVQRAMPLLDDLISRIVWRKNRILNLKLEKVLASLALEKFISIFTLRPKFEVQERHAFFPFVDVFSPCIYSALPRLNRHLTRVCMSWVIYYYWSSTFTFLWATFQLQCIDSSFRKFNFAIIHSWIIAKLNFW